MLYKPNGEIDEDEEAYLKDAIKAISDLAKIALNHEGSRDCVFSRDRKKGYHRGLQAAPWRRSRFLLRVETAAKTVDLL